MKLFKKRTSTPAESRSDLLLRLAAVDIESCRNAISVNLSKANFEYAAWNSNSAIRDHLERVGILLRAKNDRAGAQAELTAALPFVQTLEDAVNACNRRGFSEKAKSFIHLMNFTNALILLMLRQDWLRVHSLVALTALPVVKEEGLEEESGGVLDVIMRMLVATIRGDASALEAARHRFQSEQTIDRYYSAYFEYDRLMSAILAGDAQRAAEFLIALELQFSRRSTDKQLINQELLKAAGEDNILVFDVWAVALVLLARHRGITLSYSSEVVPMHEFEARPRGAAIHRT